MVRKYILNVEGVPNWKVDQASSFSALGISDRRRLFFSSLQQGDVIVTYVKGKGFVDVREIAAVGVLKLGLKSEYPEGAWPWQVRTRLIACAGLDRALSPNEFPRTKLCAGAWRYRFRLSGKLIDVEDGEVIAEAVIKLARKRTAAEASA